MQLLFDNMKDVFCRVQIWTFCLKNKFSSVKLTRGKTGFHTILWKITILQENVHLWVVIFLKYTGKIFKKKRVQRFDNYTMVLFRCKYSLSICNRHHNVSNILSCSFVASFSSKSKSNPCLISLCKCLVCCKAFFVCRINSFGILPWFFLQKSITKSPILFSLCLHMVAFKYFKY